MTSAGFLRTCAAAFVIFGAACSGGGSPQNSIGGTVGSGGKTSSGGQTGSGGHTGSGGTSANGGSVGSGGRTGTGGSTTGGSGAAGSGGSASGGTTGSGGRTSSDASAGGGTGGRDAGRDVSSGQGGVAGAGGKTGSGGAATGGTTSTTTGTAPFDCNAAMPTSGGQEHKSGMAGKDNLAWQIWSNAGSGTLTTYDVPAFHAGWDNSGNYLGRLGYEWGNSPKDPSQLGTVTAQFTETKTGSSGGQWSYIGVYGWSNNPCIEWYIIDDSYSKMPTNPGSCTNMSNSPLSVDGGKYTLCKRHTTGTGGDRCGNPPGGWDQYYSIRNDNRTCGTISVGEHFKAWQAAGNSLGKVLEVKVLLEVGGGKGTVDFPVANVQMNQ